MKYFLMLLSVLFIVTGCEFQTGVERETKLCHTLANCRGVYPEQGVLTIGQTIPQCIIIDPKSIVTYDADKLQEFINICAYLKTIKP